MGAAPATEHLDAVLDNVVRVAPEHGRQLHVLVELVEARRHLDALVHAAQNREAVVRGRPLRVQREVPLVALDDEVEHVLVDVEDVVDEGEERPAEALEGVEVVAVHDALDVLEAARVLDDDVRKRRVSLRGGEHGW
jgi:hypothetical protein